MRIKKNGIAILLLLISCILFGYSYLAAYSDYFTYHDYVDPIAFSSLFYFIAVFFTFFISNKTFKKWLKFTITWFIFDVIFVIISPTYSPYFFGGPTKESVSIWMGSFFVIISLLMFITMTVKERRKQ